MSSNCLRVLPYNGYNRINNTNSQQISFCAKKPPKLWCNPYKPSQRGLVSIPHITRQVYDYVEQDSYSRGMSVDALLREVFKNMPKIPAILPVESKSARLGNVKVNTHIDGEQYFSQAKEYVRSAKSSIQLEMFEFQNLSIDGDKWAELGAKKVAGAKDQQDLLMMIVNKKQEYPNMKIQIILDAHKWYIDSHGRNRHYNNQDMIRFLKKRGIDVVPYPRASQQGSVLQHIKLLIIDGQKAILGGMNWGTHSAANHDACISLETLNSKKGSEVDNLIEQHFNPDWKFSWYQLGRKMLVDGPLTEEEQLYYNGLAKEIKEENVQYMKVVGELYDNPEHKMRYNENRLDLIKANPIKNGHIHVLGTKPRELKEVGHEGVESTRDYLMNKLRTCHSVRGELFVLSDKDVINTIIKRVKTGELDAKFLVNSEMFPYCRTAYNKLMENGIEVRIYNGDEAIHQRLHSKWAVFDEKDIMIGSTNWSAQGLTQNVGKGFRHDYDLVEEEINKEVEQYKRDVKKFENRLNLPNTSGLYSDISKMGRRLGYVIKKLNKQDKVEFKLGKKTYTFKKDQKSILSKIKGYYGVISYRYNCKQKYKRGNNELEVAFESPSLANRVFLKQFDRDWKYSEDDYEKMKYDVMPMILAAKPNFNEVRQTL